jgi:2-keto-4-pentenoate hydratase
MSSIISGQDKASTAALASALVEARRSGKPIRTVGDDLVPAGIAEAIAVQSAVAAMLGEEPGGWKISIAPQGRVAAPMFRSGIMASGGTRTLRDGFFAIEVEFAVRLKRDLVVPVGTRLGRAEILDAVDTLLVGIELIESRLEDHPNQPFMAFLADNIANGGYVTGTERPFDASADLTGRHCRVDLDGEVLFDAPAVHGNGDPLVPLVECVGVVGSAMGGWRTGHVITTGSICGVVPVKAMGRITASISGAGEATVTLV